jgi:hypothetical protein
MTEAMDRSRMFELVKRYAILAYGGLGTMLALGLMVLGSLLVGLAIAVFLAGFDLIDQFIEELSTEALFGSSLVILVAGLLFLGVATESPLGRGRRLVGYELWEIGIARILAVAAVGILMLILHGFMEGRLAELPEPFLLAADGLEAVARGALIVMPILGVPLSLAARFAAGRRSVPDLELPALFVVWVVTAMITMS